MPKHPDFHLTARTDVGPHRRGDHIEEKADVEAILNGEHVAHFVRVAADNEVDPVEKIAPQVVEQPATRPAVEAKT